MALPEGVAAAMRLLRLAAPDVAAFGAEPKAGRGAARLADLSARRSGRFRNVGARNLCHSANPSPIVNGLRAPALEARDVNERRALDR